MIFNRIYNFQINNNHYYKYSKIIYKTNINKFNRTLKILKTN